MIQWYYYTMTTTTTTTTDYALWSAPIQTSLTFKIGSLTTIY